jgi:hypothetical protein
MEKRSPLKRTVILTSLLFSFSIKAELPMELLSIQKGISRRDFPKNCGAKLNQWMELLASLNQKPALKSPNHEQILQRSFNLRLQLHKKLSALNVDCKKLTQGLFARIREYEDLVGATHYEQIKIENVNYTKVNAPILDHKGYPPYHLNPKFKKFNFEDGDILITKGISTISSTITTFTDHYSPFSHIAFVHVDPEKKQAETIESYVGKGVSFFSMVDAMKNENARILVLRPKDRDLAKKAAAYMRERVKSAFSKGSYIPYDYQLDFSDNKTLSCEEVAFDSFKTASGGSFTIPEAPSLIKFESEDLTSRVGMKKGRMMMPADMEVDSRFEIVLDWTDFRIIRDSWRKDVMMNAALHANEAGVYDFPENYKTRLVPLIWGLRKTPLLWPLASKISGIPEDFTPDVPALSISTIGSFKQIEANHLQTLQQFDGDYFRENGHWPRRDALFEKMKESIKQYKKK